MQEHQNPSNNHQKGEQEDRVRNLLARPWNTGIMIAVWVFIGGFFLLRLYIYDHIPSDPERTAALVESVFSLAVVVVIVVHAVMYYKQAKAMDAQLEVSNRLTATALRQFEITDRPWLAVDVLLGGPLTFDEQGGNLPFRIVVTNVGRSVAVNTTINAKVIIPNPEQDMFRTVAAEHSRICQDIHSQIMSYALFPDRSFIQEISFGLGPEQLEQGRWGDSKFIQVYFVGCVDYQFSGHDAHHQTRFSYEVHRTQIGHEGATLATLIGEDVPVERLLLRKTIMGRGDYAD